MSVVPPCASHRQYKTDAGHTHQNTQRCRHRRELAELLATKPWGDKTRRYFLTRPEEYREGLKAALGIWCAALEHAMSFT